MFNKVQNFNPLNDIIMIENQVYVLQNIVRALVNGNMVNGKDVYCKNGVIKYVSQYRVL